MRKPAKERTFTLDALHDLQDKYGKLTLELICETFDTYPRRYLVSKLSAKKKDGALTYGHNFADIELLKPRSSSAVDVIKREELGRLKTWFYVQELYGLTEDIISGELKPRERVKARELRVKVLKNLTSGSAVEYAKQYEEKIGRPLPWQEILN